MQDSLFKYPTFLDEPLEVKALLDKKFEEFNNADFIENDPISVPHLFNKKQDIEIAAFWTAILSWGQRITIIKKAVELFGMMDFSPYEFMLGHQESDLIPFTKFKHRTFNGDDTLYFIHFFKIHYQSSHSLETAFFNHDGDYNAYDGISMFTKGFFGLQSHLDRTCKHVSSPLKNSACKRINMFLRWMVRDDGKGVDFGLWKSILPSQLICPCDVHVNRVARKLGLITRPQSDWKSAVELTENLSKMDPDDPVKYDYALFGLGLEGF